MASCGGGGPEARDLTGREAARLAETLFINHRQGSASFEVVTLSAPGGDRLAMAGTVDWSGTSGSARVRSDSPGATLEAVAWGGSTVAERRPLLDGDVVALGGKEGTWFRRIADRNRRTDQVIAVVMGLATRRPDNSVLIQQAAGSAFLRADLLRGRVVDVMRYGMRSVFWVDRETGELLRFEGNTADGDLPVVVDLRVEHGGDPPQPHPDDVVDTGTYPDLAPRLSGP